MAKNAAATIANAVTARASNSTAPTSPKESKTVSKNGAVTTINPLVASLQTPRGQWTVERLGSKPTDNDVKAILAGMAQKVNDNNYAALLVDLTKVNGPDQFFIAHKAATNSKGKPFSASVAPGLRFAIGMAANAGAIPPQTFALMSGEKNGRKGTVIVKMH